MIYPLSRSSGLAFRECCCPSTTSIQWTHTHTHTCSSQGCLFPDTHPSLKASSRVPRVATGFLILLTNTHLAGSYRDRTSLTMCSPRALTHTHTCVHAHTHTQTHACTYAHTHLYTPIHTHTHEWTRASTHTQAHAHRIFLS